MNRLLYLYPIVLSSIGVGIHFFGALALFQLEIPRSIHGLMLVIDLLVVIGLMKLTVWAYWLAVLLYIQQSIMQPYWAYEAFKQGHGLFHLLITCPLLFAALLVLVCNKRLFIQSNRQTET